MKTCTYCGRENTDEAVACAECGTDQFKAAGADGGPVGEPPGEWVTVETCPTLIDADVVAGQLEASGIKVFMPDEFVQQTFSLGGYGFGFARVQVAPADVAQAKEILFSPTSVLPPPPPTTPPPAPGAGAG